MRAAYSAHGYRRPNPCGKIACVTFRLSQVAQPYRPPGIRAPFLRKVLFRMLRCNDERHNIEAFPLAGAGVSTGSLPWRLRT